MSIEMGSESNEWLLIYERTDEALAGVATDYRNYFNSTQSTSSSETQTTKERRILQRRVTQCRTDVTKLERMLTNMEAQPLAYKIGEGELTRRRGLLANLKTRLTTVDDLASGKTTSKKKELLGGYGGLNSENFVESEEIKRMSNRDMAQQQQQQFQRQDEQLEVVLDGVTKLKHMGQDINTELDLHKHLLSDLDEAIDHTDEKLRINTQRVESVNEKAGGCCGMITMVILLVLIIVLLSSNMACHIFKPSSC